ncbi:hypothetical protein A6R68_09483, partial [Neotoma lepida]
MAFAKVAFPQLRVINALRKDEEAAEYAKLLAKSVKEAKEKHQEQIAKRQSSVKTHCLPSAVVVIHCLLCSLVLLGQNGWRNFHVYDIARFQPVWLYQ